MRPTKAAADEAIVNFYGALIEMETDDSDVPGVKIMMPVSEVRAIIRDRNALEAKTETHK